MSTGVDIQEVVLDFAERARSLGVTIDPVRAARWLLAKYPTNEYTMSEISRLVERAAAERNVPILGAAGQGRA